MPSVFHGAASAVCRDTLRLLPSPAAICGGRCLHISVCVCVAGLLATQTVVALCASRAAGTLTSHDSEFHVRAMAFTIFSISSFLTTCQTRISPCVICSHAPRRAQLLHDLLPMRNCVGNRMVAGGELRSLISQFVLAGAGVAP